MNKCFCLAILDSHSRRFVIWKPTLCGALFWSPWPHCTCFIH